MRDFVLSVFFPQHRRNKPPENRGKPTGFEYYKRRHNNLVSTQVSAQHDVHFDHFFHF